MLTNRDAFVSQWAPKVGTAAAVLRWRSGIHLLSGYLSQVVWIPLVVAGLKLGEPAAVVAGAVVGRCGFLLVLTLAGCYVAPIDS